MSEKIEFATAFMTEMDGIGIYTMNRPEKLNALDPMAYEDLARFARYLNDSDLKVGIITGAGDKAFAAGADIGAFESMKPADMAYGGSAIEQETLCLLEDGKKTVIAAINGYALGGGLELALACDIRILSENARLGLPEVSLGLIPGSGGTQRLARIAGIGVAKQMILTGESISAQQALTCHLAYKVVPGEQLMDEAMKLAKRISSHAPLALQTAKHLINISADTDIRTGLDMEKTAFGLLLSTEDLKEGTDAFMHKRKPEYKGK